MSDEALIQEDQKGHMGKSVVAVLIGVIVGAVLTAGTDVWLYKIGVFPPLGQPTPSRPLALATFYHAFYQVLSSYIIARLAPNQPMAHALLGGVIALLVSIGGVARWNPGLGPLWYPVALVVLAMPTAWLGGWCRVRQLGQLALTR